MTKREIIRRLDEIEAGLFGLYRGIERLRLNLQEEWQIVKSPLGEFHHGRPPKPTGGEPTQETEG